MRIFVLIACLFSLSIQAQEKVWVFFDSKTVSEEEWLHPERFLSERAIDRREKQNIELHISDFPINDDYITEIRNLGFEVLQKSKWLNALSLSYVDDEQLSKLESLPFVKDVQKMKLKQSVSSIDLSKQTTSKVSNQFIYGDSFFQINQMNGTYLHDRGFTGEGMLIAVIDGGFEGANFYSPFDSLWKNDQILSTYDFVDGDTNVFHLGSHGTSVLSVMGAYVNGSLIGTAPKADYVLLKSEDESQEVKSEEDNWIAAAEYADSVGADIINSSLGYNTFDGGIGDYTYEEFDGKTTIVSEGARFAQRKGIIVCNSMGNEGAGSWKYMLSPADVDSIISVGGVNKNDNYAGFASVGPTADDRLKPNVSALATGVYVVNGANLIVPGNGTSFASPLVAGLTACLWQASPSKTHMEIIETIEKSAHQYFNPDTLIGHGIPNYASAFAMISLDEEKTEGDFVVSPNPFENEIYIDFKRDLNLDELNVTLLDISGRSIENIESFKNDNRLILKNLSELPSGIYILKIDDKNNSKSIKLMH